MGLILLSWYNGTINQLVQTTNPIGDLALFNFPMSLTVATPAQNNQIAFVEDFSTLRNWYAVVNL